MPPSLYAAHAPQRCVEKELRVGGLEDMGVGLTFSEPVCSLSSGREMLVLRLSCPLSHAVSETADQGDCCFSAHQSLVKTGKGSVVDPAALAVGMSDFALPC